MSYNRVAIGGTFACDEALAVPLHYLLTNAVWNVDVDLQWLRYGSLIHFDEWSNGVLHPARPVDLIVLLVRLSDLVVAHPELQHRCTNHDEDRVIASNVERAVLSFLNDLERYDSMANSPPLIVLLCPCPPTMAAKFDAIEGELREKIKTMQNVTMQTSKQLLELFKQQYTTAFYNAITDERQHSPYTQAMLNVLSLSLCRQICRLFRLRNNSKKVIVLDCDNTLWGGAIAEVGSFGIKLEQRFLSLQRFVVAQQQKGMLIALCSKNIPKDVLEVFKLRRHDMVLNLEKHVVATKINWQPKSDNIVQLAKELNVGLDSFIFIDDNPLECSEVSSALPSVTVIPLGVNFSESVLDHEWIFDEFPKSSSCRASANTCTKEDGLRTQLYQQNFQRHQLRQSFSTHKAFLNALDVKIVFEELNHDQELKERSPSFTRALQLHHRTNQFNTATTFAKRLKEETLLNYVAQPENIVICTHVTDRFGHYGLVSVALGRYERSSNILRIDSFLLSCRALNRGVEHAVVRKLSEIASKAGATVLKVAWEPTERNQPAHAFFSALFDVRFVVKNEQHRKVFGKEKQQLSRSNDGSWLIEADRGSRVFFLEAECFHQSSSREIVSEGWISHLYFSLSPINIARSVIWLMLSFHLLPHMLTHLLKPFLIRLIDKRPSGMLRIPFRDRGSLESFVSPALKSAKDSVIKDIGNSDSNDDKFRRKARHQAKLALVSHVHVGASRVIWSANRPHAQDQSSLGNSTNSKSVSDNGDNKSAIRIQLVCESPECLKTLQRGSQCTFRRCRICCYRVQRLLMRSIHHANCKARLSASHALKPEFSAGTYVGATKRGDLVALDTQWCAVHQDKRRRGETFKQRPNK